MVKFLILTEIPLANSGVHIIGTSAKMIDNAEDRQKFNDMIDEIGVQQPRWRTLTTADDALDFSRDVGYPGMYSYLQF